MSDLEPRTQAGRLLLVTLQETSERLDDARRWQRQIRAIEDEAATPSGNWHHIAVTRDESGSGVGYVDGQRVYEYTATPSGGPLDDLRRLSDAATPGKWYRYTVGHKSVRQAAGAVTRALFSVNVDAEIRPLMTDMSWVETDATEEHVALVGNGPKQTDNADFIAACVNYVRARLTEEPG